MRIWFDTEFIEDGVTIDLISIGCVREDGATFYAESNEVDWSKAGEWVNKNVVPHLEYGDALMSRKVIRDKLIEFAGKSPEFWAWYASYDWQVLCQLHGRMMDLPSDWPMFVMDLRAMMKMNNLDPKNFLVASHHNLKSHNALADALWLREQHISLQQRGFL